MLNNRYQIYQELSEGGFGTTFLAKDTQTPSHKTCVIKKLKPLNHNTQIYELVKQRFQREAAILETLGDRHEQIPRLYAYFEDQGNFYLVQEWINGQTLQEKVTQEGILTENKVKTILTNILQVLQEVQSNGIIHRDIKPENIILRYPQEQPVLIDFGAVKETVAANNLNTSGQLKSSIIIGTPGFMALEQSLGKPLFASDIYSLGLTAIYLLTGKLPDELELNPETGEMLWRRYAPTVSPGFAAVLDKAIEPNFIKRYINARTMLEALDCLEPASKQVMLQTRMEQSQPVISTPKTLQAILPQNLSNPNQAPYTPVISNPRKTNILPVIVGSLVVLGVFAGGGAYFFKPQSAPIQPQSPQSTQNIPPQVTIGGKTEEGKKPLAFIDGAWQLNFRKAGTEFNNTLVMKGEYGEMYTQYLDPQTGQPEKLYQKVRLWSVSQGLILKGDTPLYVGSQEPHPTYTSDQILFQHPGKSKTFRGENCSAGECFPVTFTYKGQSLD